MAGLCSQRIRLAQWLMCQARVLHTDLVFTFPPIFATNNSRQNFVQVLRNNPLRKQNVKIRFAFTGSMNQASCRHSLRSYPTAHWQVIPANATDCTYSISPLEDIWSPSIRTCQSAMLNPIHIFKLYASIAITIAVTLMGRFFLQDLEEKKKPKTKYVFHMSM